MDTENNNKDKARRRVGIAFILVFALMIVVPTLTVNLQPDAVSERENRVLNNFPSAETARTEGLKQFRDAFTAGLQDRIGMRDPFVFTADAAKLYALRQSPSEMIRKGKDGWYFYTGENNVDIGTGAYRFTEEYLSLVAENQSMIDEYYRGKGIPYFFMPSPGKPGIYPEYLPGDFSVQPTVIDQVTETLQSETDVNVIAVKDYLIGHKGEGQLYFRQDSHWNAMGSYFVYERILEEMNRAGVLNNASPVEAEVVDKNYGPGEFNNYFGGALPDEYAPDMAWDASARKIESGEMYDRLMGICREGDLSGLRLLSSTVSIYENPGAVGGRLLIYGDSQMNSRLKLPAYLAEHFSFVMSVGRIPNVYGPLEDEIRPDVVLLQRSERALNFLFMDPGEPVE